MRIKNFYSVADEVMVDFTVTKNNPKGFTYKSTGIKNYDERGSLINVMIGPNASGKTNIVKALSALKHLIADSQADPEEAGVYYFWPNALHADEPSELGVKFSADKKLFEYNFVFDRRRILKEELAEYSRVSERFTAKKVFTRSWNDKEQVYKARFYYPELVELLTKDLRSNASIISVAKQLPRYEFAQKISSYWQQCVASNIAFTNWYPEPKNRIDFLDRAIDNKSLREKIDDLLRRFDIGYNGIERYDMELDGQKHYAYFVSHTYADKKFSTVWQEESEGTKRMFKILEQAISVLSKKDGVMIIDELDSGLHPDLAEAIVDLFQDKDINVNKTQLIFNTHDHRILSTLDKQQIFLVEKNDIGSTEIWRLDEVDGVRSDDNYYAKYMAGAYAAKPRIN